MLIELKEEERNWLLNLLNRVELKGSEVNNFLQVRNALFNEVKKPVEKQEKKA